MADLGDLRKYINPVPEPDADDSGEGQVEEQSAPEPQEDGGQAVDAEAAVESGAQPAPEPDAEPGETPDASAEPGETPDASAEPGETPDANAEPGETPDASAEPGETPDVQGEPGTIGDIEAEPGTAEDVQAEPSTTEEVHAESGETPPVDAEVGETPETEAEPAETPEVDAEPGDFPKMADFDLTTLDDKPVDPFAPPIEFMSDPEEDGGEEFADEPLAEPPPTKRFEPKLLPAAAADYYTLSSQWRPVLGDTPTPVDWQNCTPYVLWQTGLTEIDLDVPYVGFVRAIVVTFNYTSVGGPWDVRVYNVTSATAVGSPEITDLVDYTSYSAVGGTLACAVHDKLRVQIRGAEPAESTVFSMIVNIILERT